MIKFLIFISGGAFGAGLLLSGVYNPAKVIGVLDFTGKWDPTLLVVMTGAIGVYAPLNYWIRRLRTRALSGREIHPCPKDPVSLEAILGAGIFGIGWGLGGICPGPAITNLGAGYQAALVFIPGMILGMFVARTLFKTD